MVINNLFRTKRGIEEILSLYWILILIIVAGGIIGMVFVFYGNPYDVREIEATLLIDKLADCISYGGRINGITNINQGIKEFDFSRCHINFSAEKNEFFYKIVIYRIEDLENPFFETRGGNFNLESSCFMEKTKTLPVCVEKSFYSLDELDNQYIIKVLVSVRKTEKNV